MNNIKQLREWRKRLDKPFLKFTTSRVSNRGTPAPLAPKVPPPHGTAPVLSRMSSPMERYRVLHQLPLKDHYTHGPGLGSFVWFCLVSLCFLGWNLVPSDPTQIDGILEPAIEYRHLPGSIRSIPLKN